ncbi:DUF5989 family protein [uncultured Mycobacterium sp.]|uniref:DUF5989 family protein n=1 Tax=uncultured Mycobacterium sp. TaxID=171292 RepID=UPI0035CA3314
MPDSDFERAASERSTTFIGEFWQFLRHNKKWWLAPIVATLLLVAVLIFLAESSGAGSFIYTLF